MTDLEWSTPTQEVVWTSTTDPKIIFKTVKYATVVPILGPGPQGPRGTSIFVSTKALDDETFDPEVDILGYPAEGLLPGDLVIDPTGDIYIWS